MALPQVETLPPNSLSRILIRNKFALAAFLLPLAVRAIPEIIVGPYPIGYDAITFYVPATIDWAAGRVSLMNMLGTAPLMYMISVPAYLFGADPVWIFKILGPVLYGCMASALYRFTRLRLEWSQRKSLAGIAVITVYFITLRIGWDLYRTMLGLVFVLLSLSLPHESRGNRETVLRSVLVTLAVLSDQFIGAIALSLTIARALLPCAKWNRQAVTRTGEVFGPGAIAFALILYTGIALPNVGLVSEHPPLPSTETITWNIGFLAYAYVLLAPLIFIGWRRTPNSDLRNWSIVCLIGAVSVLFPFLGPNAPSGRWVLLLDLPFCTYSTAGLSVLMTPRGLPQTLIGRIRKLAIPSLSLFLIILGSLYILVPAQQAMTYYTLFPTLMPTSMIQNSIPSSDMPSLRYLLNQAALDMQDNSVLITHEGIYGWAREYLPGYSDRVVNYGHASPILGVQMARSAGYSKILMIWWVNGSGWYGQRDVPSGFSPLTVDGNMAIYQYN